MLQLFFFYNRNTRESQLLANAINVSCGLSTRAFSKSTKLRTIVASKVFQVHLLLVFLPRHVSFLVKNNKSKILLYIDLIGQLPWGRTPRIFENKMLCRMVEPTGKTAVGKWKKLHNVKLRNDILLPSIIGAMRRKRRWMEHLTLMREANSLRWKTTWGNWTVRGFTWLSMEYTSTVLWTLIRCDIL